MVNIKEVTKASIEEIVEVEVKTFIPSIQADRGVIIARLNKNHTYLGAFIEEKLVGTLGFRYDQFSPNFVDFITRNPNFEMWANEKSESEANAVFVYTLGVVPEYRNGIVAKALINNALGVAKAQGKEFLVGDARIPSYNGSFRPGFGRIKQNLAVKRSIDESLVRGDTISRNILAQDPILGFYLRVFPQFQILGITNADFIKEDDPSGGHRVIVYQDLRK